MFHTNIHWSKQISKNGPDMIGKMNWKFSLQDVVSTSEPVIDAQGNILFGANNGDVFSISKEGTTNWRVNIGKGAQSSPTLDHEQYLYLVVNHGDRNSLYKVDGAGNLLWATRLEHNKHFEPILDKDGNIYIVTWHDLVKINSAGYHLWSFSCRNISSYPVFDSKGNVYFSAREEPGVLISLTKDGDLRWKKEYGKCYLEFAPIVDKEDHLYFAFADEQSLHSLYSIDTDGNMNWKYTPGDRGFISSPALSNEGYLVLGTTYFRVCAVDTSGQLLWETDLGHITQFSPILDHRNQVYLFTVVKKRKPESYIWCLDQHGQPLWKHRFRGAMTWFNLSLEGLLLTKFVDADRFDVDLVAYEIK